MFAIRTPLALRWSSLAFRGVASLVLGIVALAWPSASFIVLALMFAAYSFLDGMLALVVAVDGPSGSHDSALLSLDGLVGIAAALGALLWPGLTLVGLAVLMGARFAVLGVLQIVTAARLRTELKSPVLYAVVGAMSLFFGLVTFAVAGMDALFLLTMLSGFALGLGVLFVAIALRARGHSWLPRSFPFEVPAQA